MGKAVYLLSYSNTRGDNNTEFYILQTVQYRIDTGAVGVRV